ncbi:ATP-binding cassette domain-containing protein [Nonomuraea sp. NPDC048826]|uniref:ATP-binding cassette domain-containing protein n=1 Tax=Nonomuraea sp. NPDC048826 TaxID=3364347 RepID=UPI003710F6F3
MAQIGARVASRTAAAYRRPNSTSSRPASSTPRHPVPLRPCPSGSLTIDPPDRGKINTSVRIRAESFPARRGPGRARTRTRPRRRSRAAGLSIAENACAASATENPPAGRRPGPGDQPHPPGGLHAVHGARPHRRLTRPGGPRDRRLQDPLRARPRRDAQRHRAARIGLLTQESSPPSRRRAVEVYEAAIGRLVTSGALREPDQVGLSQLGLLPAEAARRPVTELSVGQRRRLDLAVVLAARPHVVLMDEPTNHLSMTLVEELTEALGATAAAVVLATHDRQLLRDTEGWPRLRL